jgi:hypothetical protein
MRKECCRARKIGLDISVTGNTGVPGSIPGPATVFSPLYLSNSIVLVVNGSFLAYIADRNNNS